MQALGFEGSHGDLKLMCAQRQVHWPDRYVSLFGGSAYDVNLERPDDVPFEEQLRGLEAVVKAGKVPSSACHHSHVRGWRCCNFVAALLGAAVSHGGSWLASSTQKRSRCHN